MLGTAVETVAAGGFLLSRHLVGVPQTDSFPGSGPAAGRAGDRPDRGGPARTAEVDSIFGGDALLRHRLDRQITAPTGGLRYLIGYPTWRGELRL